MFYTICVFKIVIYFCRLTSKGKNILRLQIEIQIFKSMRHSVQREKQFKIIFHKTIFLFEKHKSESKITALNLNQFNFDNTK